MKTMTLRLDDECAATLELIARADDKTVTDTVRSAIDEHIAARRKDKAFMGRLKARHERERELFERLAE
jgi:predicted transcriptional regulator